MWIKYKESEGSNRVSEEKKDTEVTEHTGNVVSSCVELTLTKAVRY